MQSPAIGISARLDRDTIIACIKRTVFYQYIRARLRIATIVIWTGAVDRELPYCDIRAQHGMHLPHRRILDGYAFDQHVLATVWLNELRTQVRTFAKLSFADRSPILRHFVQQIARLGCAGLTFLPSPVFTSGPAPPVLKPGLPIKRTFPRDRDVLLLEG